MEFQVIGSGSSSLFIEKEPAQRGRNFAGYTAPLPHYLSSSPYPHATHQLLDAVSEAAGLNLPLKSLEHDIERVNIQLEEQVNDSEEIVQVVHSLEEIGRAHV